MVYKKTDKSDTVQSTSQTLVGSEPFCFITRRAHQRIIGNRSLQEGQRVRAVGSVKSHL